MKTKIKKRIVDTRAKYKEELFPSMTQPLREALDGGREPSRRDVEFNRVRKKALFADEISTRSDGITKKINNDRFSLRALLCDEEAYAFMREMALTQDKKVRQALLFLREYGLLIKMGYFEMRAPVDTSPIIVFALKHVSSYEIRQAISSGDYRPLIKGLMLRVEKEIEWVKPLLRDFVESHFFAKKARLSSSPEKRTSPCEEEKMQKGTEGGELILFSMNVEKEVKLKKIRKIEKKRESLEVATQKEKRRKNLVQIAEFLVPTLKIVGLLIPCLALTAIPGVGFLLSLACLVLLGTAAFTYYMVPIYKKEKRCQDSLKEERWEEEEVFLQNLESPELKCERRKTAAPKTEKRATESAFMHQMPPSPKDIKTSLGGGQWLAEDRKRREQRAANDKVSQPYKDNDLHPCLPNMGICILSITQLHDRLLFPQSSLSRP